MTSKDKNGWAKFIINILVGVIMLIMMFILTQLSVSQAKQMEEINKIQMRSTINQTVITSIMDRLDRIEKKLDEIIER